MANAIELDHVGPIEHLSIPIPEGGGVVVLKGRNGSGKSHALASVEALYSKDARKGLRNSDGVPAGSVDGLGVTIRLGRVNTARGELVCESLDGRIDPSQLVDPGLKDPTAADSRRLATLIRLAGIKVGLDDWLKLFGGSDSIVKEIALESIVDADPVVSADKIRRRLHDLALARERISNSKAAEAATLFKQVEGIDLEWPHDPLEINKRLEDTIKGIAAAHATNQAAESLRERQAEAETKIAALRDVEGFAAMASQDVRIYTASVDQFQIDVDNLRAKLASAEQALETAKAAKFNAEKRQRMAEADLEKLAELQAVIQSAQLTVFSAESIQAMEAAREQAKADIEKAVTVRQAKETAAKARGLSAVASLEAEQAERIRVIARSTDQVLEDSLIAAGFDSIKVQQGRLCVASDRGLEPFSELSHGERWRFALDLAARGLPKGAVLPVCQEAFESLDPANRDFVSTLARDRGLVIVTAEATDGELRAEILSTDRGDFHGEAADGSAASELPATADGNGCFADR